MKQKLYFKNWSLTFKFLLVFLIMITLPTIYFGAFIYFKMNETFKIQATESTEDILDKIEMSLTSVIQDVESITAYAIFNEDFRTFITTPEDDFNEMFYIQSKENIKGYLTYQLLSKDYINSFTVRGNNGQYIDLGEPVEGDESKWDYIAEHGEGKLAWSNTYEMSSAWKDTEKTIQVVSLSRVINDYNNINQPIGFIRIRLDIPKLNEIIELSKLRKEGKVYIKNAEGNIILISNDDENSDWERAVINKLSSDEITTSITNDGQEFLFVKRDLTPVDWELIAVVNQNSITDKLVYIKYLIRNMVMILTLLGLLALIGYYFLHIRRIIDFTKTTERIMNRDFSVKVKVNSMDEIGQLGTRFNRMVYTIRNLIDKEYKLKIKQKESEMKALQSQIDPHFLYNTLDMIRWKARIENAKETSHLIEMLSRIFRNTLKNDKLFNSLKEELLFISSYLDFQSKRMNGKLGYRIETDLNVEDYFIIKQTIQPLIENSIKHGFYNQKEDMQINIHCYVEQSSLIVDVVDNGQGMAKLRFDEIIGGKENHGLKNIQERIQLAFGSSYGLTFVNMELSGTWIQVKIPAISSYPDFTLYGLGEENND